MDRPDSLPVLQLDEQSVEVDGELEEMSRSLVDSIIPPSTSKPFILSNEDLGENSVIQIIANDREDSREAKEETVDGELGSTGGASVFTEFIEKIGEESKTSEPAEKEDFSPVELRGTESRADHYVILQDTLTIRSSADIKERKGVEAASVEFPALGEKDEVAASEGDFKENNHSEELFSRAANRLEQLNKKIAEIKDISEGVSGILEENKAGHDDFQERVKTIKNEMDLDFCELNSQLSNATENIESRIDRTEDRVGVISILSHGIDNEESHGSERMTTAKENVELRDAKEEEEQRKTEKEGEGKKEQVKEKREDKEEEEKREAEKEQSTELVEAVNCRRKCAIL